MGVPEAVLRQMHEVGRDLYQQRLVTSHGGNLSRRDGQEMWITGTGTMLGRLHDRHIARVRTDGSYEGPQPSSDTILHTTIYAITDAAAVVHAHPRHAIALSFELDRFVPEDLEGSLHLQEVPVIAQGPRQVEEIALALRERRIALLRGHGAYAKGKDLWEALHWTTALEESAEIAVIRRRF
ncbi:MAG TPA: class II aldolase/adducin family protein [Tepidiformaceae bacterium]|nr:class II aldolase/adducin family protein [Tepidiformaceae bacterium]